LITKTKTPYPVQEIREPKPALRVFSARLPARKSRHRGGYAMWTALFTVTAVIAVALSLVAIAMDSVKGGKFRL
jgi:hypothetical protein